MCGIDFGAEAPDYTDFAYLALTIGMTYVGMGLRLTGSREPRYRGASRDSVVYQRFENYGRLA